jgi:hypothetical protein
MKKLLLVAALALTCVSIAAPRANAQSAQFTFTPTSFSDVTAGSTITFRIDLVFTAGGNFSGGVEGLTYFLQQSSPGSPFPFTIVGRDTSGSQFSDLLQSNSQVFANGPQLNPSNDRDLGALTETGPLPSDTYFIANITLQVANNALAGTYTIQSTTTGGQTSVINNSNGDTFPIQPGTLTVVVPEPSTYALLAVGAIAAGVGMYRRRRTA